MRLYDISPGDNRNYDVFKMGLEFEGVPKYDDMILVMELGKESVCVYELP